MSYYVTLISLLSVMAFVSGSLVLFIQGEPQSELSLKKIERVKGELYQNNLDFYSFDADSSLKLISNASLLDPETSLPQTLNFDRLNLRALQRYAKSCKESAPRKDQMGKLEKAWEWQGFLCGHHKKLTSNFFKRLPHIAPFGESFAFLAYKSKREEFKKPLWIAENLKYFHILEWKIVFKEHLNTKDLPVLSKVLSSFDFNNAWDFSNRLPLIISKKYILLKKDFEAEANHYQVYERQKLEQIFQKII